MAEWHFDRDAIRAFRFVRCEFDPAIGVARLVYAFDRGPELVETISVPGAPFALDPARASAVERAPRRVRPAADLANPLSRPIGAIGEFMARHAAVSCSRTGNRFPALARKA